MMAIVDVQIACNQFSVPKSDLFTQWVDCALEFTQNTLAKELSIRVVDCHESQELNTQFRGKTSPTNVLSFSCELPAEVDLPLIGDLAICAEIVDREARAQDKSLESHWAHMVVHGTMHLLGYDHIDEHEAQVMESIETHILAELGYPSPY